MNRREFLKNMGKVGIALGLVGINGLPEINDDLADTPQSDVTYLFYSDGVLYAGEQSTNVNGCPSNKIATWDSSAWSELY